ncbi:hypothetical protein [Bacillus sp. CECT 9360]|uniref:hypothetical protein n=1 Tax=Bacillus sp. CECT 9360 TaxID=2845821 RepID=UPI001E5E146F|nr:hypothetical protein [Bacillus sp. CECT 9360]CAH0346551.1 hypothetical protein BCI9360_02890 [Bacillus sp. CECT 9360]
MGEILNKVKLSETEERSIPTDRAKKYVKIRKLEEEIAREKSVLEELSAEEIAAIEDIFKKDIVDEVPQYLSVKEVSMLTGLTPQIVRRHCANRKYAAYQPGGGNGTWHIESSRFRTYPNWLDFIQKRNELFSNSQQVAKLAVQLWDEDESEKSEE